jgi:hypothetical protein
VNAAHGTRLNDRTDVISGRSIDCSPDADLSVVGCLSTASEKSVAVVKLCSDRNDE